MTMPLTPLQAAQLRFLAAFADARAELDAHEYSVLLNFVFVLVAGRVAERERWGEERAA